jgi:tRNA modification GTPase
MIDTIAAISTAFGEAAIAVLRVSGPRAVEVAGALWRGRLPVAELAPRAAAHGALYSGDQRLDDVLLTVFRAPHSYTGEDVVEISAHGGVLVTRRILEALLRAGARAAEPGEFTQRAFLHGKMDLTQAEAVMDVIRAQTDLALSAAHAQLSGRLGDRIRALRQAVLDTLAHVEAYIDFPDEDLDPDTNEAMRTRLFAARSEVETLLATAQQGRVLREGVRTVIYGAPNVGKSSLLNLLLGHERAIVSHHPGTTRDVIEETINLRGIPFRLLDTAGVRATSDEVEQAGIARTQRAVEGADLILQVEDASAPRVSELPGLLSHPTLVVLNKSDLGEHGDWAGVDAARISCRTNAGLDALETAMVAAATGGAMQADWTLAVNARHAACLERAQRDLTAALDAFAEGLSPEFIAEELRAAMEAIGDIAGRADSEELLGVIFGQFCIGK